MKFVCTGVLLVVLLASSLARPNYFPRWQYDAEMNDRPYSSLARPDYFPGRQYDAEINQGPYLCFFAPNCESGHKVIRVVPTIHECCSTGGQSFLDAYTAIYQCSPWLVQRDQ